MLDYNEKDYNIPEIKLRVDELLQERRTPKKRVKIYGSSDRDREYEVFLNGFSSRIIIALQKKMSNENLYIGSRGVGNYSDGISIGFSKTMRKNKLTLCSKIVALLSLVTE